jgi:hypothetical protein
MVVFGQAIADEGESFQEWFLANQRPSRKFFQ